MIKQFYFKQFNLVYHFVALSLNVKQFYLTHNAITPGQSGSRRNGNEGVLSITGASPSADWTVESIKYAN